MSKNWTFGQKLGAGFAFVVALALLIAAVATYALRTTVASKDAVITTDAQGIIDAGRLALISSRSGSAMRGYFLTRQDAYLQDFRADQSAFAAQLEKLRQRTTDPEGKKLLDDIAAKEDDYREAAERVLATKGAPAEALAKSFDEQIAPRRDLLNGAIDAYVAYGERKLDHQKRAASDAAETAVNLVLVFSAIAVLLAVILALVLTRGLGRQIGGAVGQVQGSSTELQAAANQQATSTKEQATAMNEITTTITELLVTSKQIAESAQRVAHIAEQTATAARAGDSTLERAGESIHSIRRQVDLVVSHMLELGKKSQQIGAVLDIVAELAEQTNILAINATIEAAGAGDAGKRFSVVADEIRKLADRVGSSTKEIRTLIDDVRGSVNATVMTTETGSKAVDAGTKQFSDVAASFKQIAGLVATTTEAAKEIELSTKQQATAVEQVNIAVLNVAQATRETEASSSQTLETARQLSTLSRELLRMVQPQTPSGLAPAASR